jgi:hypothetical protein
MITTTVMTYDSLVADIINYSERDDAQFVATIPTIISLAENSIAAELKTLLQLNVVETSLAVNQTVLNKPARWRKTTSMKINGEPVLLRSQDYIAQMQAESPAGKPIYYSDYDYANWNFAPKPDQVYPVEIIYYSLVQPLDSTNQQNLFTATTPQLMLYGSMYHAMVYLKALDKVSVWKGYYDNAMTAIKQEDATRRVDRNTTVQD